MSVDFNCTWFKLNDYDVQRQNLKNEFLVRAQLPVSVKKMWLSKINSKINRSHTELATTTSDLHAFQIRGTWPSLEISSRILIFPSMSGFQPELRSDAEQKRKDH